MRSLAAWWFLRHSPVPAAAFSPALSLPPLPLPCPLPSPLPSPLPPYLLASSSSPPPHRCLLLITAFPLLLSHRIATACPRLLRHPTSTCLCLLPCCRLPPPPPLSLPHRVSSPCLVLDTLIFWPSAPPLQLPPLLALFSSPWHPLSSSLQHPLSSSSSPPPSPCRYHGTSPWLAGVVTACVPRYMCLVPCMAHH